MQLSSSICCCALSNQPPVSIFSVGIDRVDASKVFKRRIDPLKALSCNGFNLVNLVIPKFS